MPVGGSNADFRFISSDFPNAYAMHREIFRPCRAFTATSQWNHTSFLGCPVLILDAVATSSTRSNGSRDLNTVWFVFLLECLELAGFHESLLVAPP